MNEPCKCNLGYRFCVFPLRTTCERMARWPDTPRGRWGAECAARYKPLESEDEPGPVVTPTHNPFYDEITRDIQSGAITFDDLSDFLKGLYSDYLRRRGTVAA